MLRKEERHKAIAIPVSFADGKPRFLTVRDRRFKEWIFVTGGCHRRELTNPLRCALRELEEETRGVVSIRDGTYSSYVYTCKNHSQEDLDKDKKDGVEVTLVYHVYIIDFNIPRLKQLEYIRKFDDAKRVMDERKKRKLSIKRTYDENDTMCFDTLEEFSKKRRWDFITRSVLDNPEFLQALNTLNRKRFSIK
jgi:8-oxo-dGTP pyrophosphatase MutT (NUDIX family)